MCNSFHCAHKNGTAAVQPQLLHKKCSLRNWEGRGKQNNSCARDTSYNPSCLSTFSEHPWGQEDKAVLQPRPKHHHMYLSYPRIYVKGKKCSFIFSCLIEDKTWGGKERLVQVFHINGFIVFNRLILFQSYWTCRGYDCPFCSRHW